MQYRVISRGQEVSFESRFASNGDALAALAATTPRSDSFGGQLLAKANRLSEKQWAWVHKLATDALTPRVEPVGIAARLDGIVRIFTNAAKHLKRPAITFSIDGKIVKLSRVGEGSRYPAGTIHVNNGCRYGAPDNRYFGRIDPDGTFHGGRDLTDDVRELLTKLSTDPAGYAGEYGRLSGRCCFCDTALTDERSTAVGYGPVCAKHYGLAWGKKPAVHPDIEEGNTFAALERQQELAAFASDPN